MKIIECTVEEYLKLQKMQDDIDTKKEELYKNRRGDEKDE